MLPIDLLQPADIPDALRLSAAAGWNQIAADWQRLLDLWPATCLAGRVAGRLVATGTMVIYEGRGMRLGWVGMILVDSACQRQGYGLAMLDEIIRCADRMGVGVLGLDATEQGRGVYLKRGFVDQQPICRWTGPVRRPCGAHSSVLRALLPGDWPSILELDRCQNLERSSLLARLAGERHAWVGTLVDATGALAAVGFVRPGRLAAHIGPLLARSVVEADVVIGLLGQKLSDRQDIGSVVLDVPQNMALEQCLQQRGFQVARRLMRMVRPALNEWPGSHAQMVAAGFELG